MEDYSGKRPLPLWFWLITVSVMVATICLLAYKLSYPATENGRVLDVIYTLLLAIVAVAAAYGFAVNPDLNRPHRPRK